MDKLMKIYKVETPARREEVRNFCYKNAYGMLMIHVGTEYYVAARCCLLNRLIIGLTFAAEAIERLLKGFIFIESQKESKNTHDLIELKNKLKSIKNYGLDEYDDLLKKLNSYFQDRYHNNQGRSTIKSTGELLEIDRLWLNLVDLLPIPEEVKFRSGTFCLLFEEADGWPHKNLLLQNNKFLIARLPELEKRYKKVMNILYPKSYSAKNRQIS